MRITVAVKGKGYGRAVLHQVKHGAFSERKANRLWLDVKETNERALQLYLSEGFRVESTLRECLKTGDVYGSVIVLSMLRREYASS